MPSSVVITNSITHFRLDNRLTHRANCNWTPTDAQKIWLYSEWYSRSHFTIWQNIGVPQGILPMIEIANKFPFPQTLLTNRTTRASFISQAIPELLEGETIVIVLKTPRVHS